MVGQLLDWLCVPTLTFCVCTHPLTTRGRARFEVGSAAHIRVAVLADILVVFVFGVVFVIFGVHSRLCSHLLAVDREVVGTHGVWWCVQPIFIP